MGDLCAQLLSIRAEPGTGGRPPFSGCPNWINESSTWEVKKRIGKSSTRDHGGCSYKDFLQDRLGTGPGSTCMLWEEP